MIKKPEEMLNEAFDGTYHEFIIDHLQESLVVIGNDYKIVDANKVFFKRYNCDSISGKYCYEVTHGYDQPCSSYGVKCPLIGVIESKVPQEVLHEHVLRDGTSIWENILAVPLIEKDGRVRYVVETLRDVTDLYNTQESLKKTGSSTL